MALIIYATVLVLSGVFMVTSCPTVFLGDSGEIIAASSWLGIGHPPGYPLYMLLAKIFTLIPAGDIAYRVNLLAAALGAAAFAPVFLLCREFLFHTGAKQEKKEIINAAAYASALAFVLHGCYWQLCTQAKGGIYILAIIVSALSLYAALRFLRAGKTKYMYFSLYLAGFLPFIHLSASIYALMSAAICAYASRKEPRRLIAGAVLMLFSFLTANLYLFIRNAGTSGLAWKGVFGFAGILGHIFRRAYTAAGPGDFIFAVYLKRLWLFASDTAGSFNVFILFFAAGAASAARKNSAVKWFAALYAAAVILFLAGSNSISGYEQNSVSENSMQVAGQMEPAVNLLFILIACCGLRIFMGKTPAFVNYGISAVIAAGFFTAGFQANDSSKMFLGYDHAVNILKTVDTDSRIFTDEDTSIFNTLYVTKVLKKFPDFRVHDRQASILNRDFYAAADKTAGMQEKLLMKRGLELDAIRKTPGKVYFTNYEDFTKDGFSSRPFGILFRTGPAGQGFTEAEIYRVYSLRDFFRNKHLNIHYRDIIARYFLMRGWEALSAGRKDAAMKWFNTAENTAPGSTVMMSLIASAYLFAANDRQEAAHYMEKTLALDPYSRNIRRSLSLLRGIR